jgi:hypothetical protein
MRAVIIGTDFMKDTDGTFKALETNTNIQLDTQWSLNFDSESFENFVLSNNFTEVVLISNEHSTSSETSHSINYEINELRSTNVNRTENSLPTIPFNFTFDQYLKSFLSESNIELITISTDATSTTVPFVEDAEDKLIIRLSFDTTALIDDNYTRDNWGFLRLMYDADDNSIPKCYINDTEFGIDSIGDTLRDNGNHPNYCIKKRVTPSDNKIYPKLFKLSTLEQLNDLKSNLEVDEYIQEYVFNTDDLFDGRLNTYRSIDLLYGSNLDIINLQVIEKTKILPLLSSADFDDTNQVQPWDRMRYLQKFYTFASEVAIELSATDNTKILLPNGTTKLATSLKLGDEVKTLNIPNIPDDDLMSNLDEWSTSYDSVINDYQLSSTFLAHEAVTSDYYGILVTFNTESNTIFSDVGHAKIMVKDGENVKFEKYGLLKIGDEVFIYDTNISQLITTKITEVNFRFDKFTAYTLDFEEIDWFITMEETENQSRYGIITHNYTYDCRYWSVTYNSGPGYCITWFTCTGGGQLTTCPWNYNLSGPCSRTLYVGGKSPASFTYSPGSADLNIGAFCNSQKPSDINYKENLTLIGVSELGLNVYQYNYKNEEGLYQGVIAQELIGTTFENALSLNIDGLYEVDYNKIDVEFKKIN